MYTIVMKTDVGKRRSLNEDSAWVLRVIVEGECVRCFKQTIVRDEKRSSTVVECQKQQDKVRHYSVTPTGKKYELAVQIKPKNTVLIGVADGMGGHEAGDVASEFVAEWLPYIFVRSWLQQGTKPGSDMTPSLDESYEHALRRAVMVTNRRLCRLAKKKGSDMGTTVTCALIVENTAIYANIGDSRGYVARNGKLHRITKDHSFVQALIDAGVISEEEAMTHPQRHVITKSVGQITDVEPDIFVAELEKNDIVMLCSDGLTDLLTDAEIENLLKNEPLEKLATRLIDAANEKGGKDNITVVLCRV